MGKTFSTVKQIEAFTRPGRYRDETTTGLYVSVRISATGLSKSYVWRGRVGGNKEREIGLGSCSKVALTDARKAAREAAVNRDRGVDPREAKKVQRAANKVHVGDKSQDVPTFECYARKCIRDTTDNFRNVYGAKAYLRAFEKHVFSSMGPIPVDQVTTRHIADVLKSAASSGVLDTAKRLRSRIGAILSAAAAEGYRPLSERNPADPKLVESLAAVLKTKRDIEHYRAAPLERIPAIYKTLAEADSNAALALRFVMLSGSRPGAALRAKWSEVDWEKRLFTIPAERQKRGGAFVIPLNEAMLEVLRAAHQFREGDGVYIFPGGRGDKPLSYNAFSTTLPKLGIHDCTPHSWRSSRRDYAGDHTSHERDVAEAALSHSLGATEASYRRQNALNKRRKLGVEWAQFCLGLRPLEVEPVEDNVVWLPGAKVA